MCFVAAINTEGAVVVGWSCMLNMYCNGVLLFCTIYILMFLEKQCFYQSIAHSQQPGVVPTLLFDMFTRLLVSDVQYLTISVVAEVTSYNFELKNAAP